MALDVGLHSSGLFVPPQVSKLRQIRGGFGDAHAELGSTIKSSTIEHLVLTLVSLLQKSLRLHYRCRERLGRILKELLLAYDALERDRRLAYYEWGGEEMRRRALEGFEYEEHDLCQWLSKLHKQYGDYGRAGDWASLRKKINVQGSDDEEHWKMQLDDVELMRGCGDADGCKQKIFGLPEDLLRRTNERDGGDLDFEALATVEEHTNVIKQSHQFYLDMPVKQGKVQPFRSLRNKQRVEPDWMEVAQDDGLELYENKE